MKGHAKDAAQLKGQFLMSRILIRQFNLFHQTLCSIWELFIERFDNSRANSRNSKWQTHFDWNTLQRRTLNASKSTSGKVLAYISTNKSTRNAGLQFTCTVNYYANESICWYLVLYFSLHIKWQLYQQNGCDTPWSVTFITHMHDVCDISELSRSRTHAASSEWENDIHSWQRAYDIQTMITPYVSEKHKFSTKRLCLQTKKSARSSSFIEFNVTGFLLLRFFSCATICMSLALFNDHDIFMHVIKMRFAYYRVFDAVTCLCLFTLRSLCFLFWWTTQQKTM